MRLSTVLVATLAAAPVLAAGFDLVPQAGMPSANLAFSPDGKLLYAGNGTVWDLQTGMLVRNLGLPDGLITLSADGRILAHEAKADYARKDQFVSFIDTATGATVGSHRRSDNATVLAFHPRDSYLARLGQFDVRYINIKGGREAIRPNNPGESPYAGAWVADNFIAVFRRESGNDIARLLFSTTLTEFKEVAFEVPKNTWQMSASAAALTFLISGTNGGGELWDSKKRTLLRKLDIPNGTRGQRPNELSPDGKFAAFYDGEAAWLVDTEGKKSPVQLKLEAPRLNAGAGADYGLAFSRDGKLLAFGATGRGFAIADVATAQVRTVLGKSPLDASSLAFSADGNYLAVATSTTDSKPGGQPADVHVWNLREGRMETYLPFFDTVKHQFTFVERVALDGKGELLAVQTLDNVFVFERRTQKLLATVGCERSYGLALAASGEFLITAPPLKDPKDGADSLVVSDPRTGKELSRIALARKQRKFALAPNDSILALAGGTQVDFYSLTEKRIVKSAEVERPLNDGSTASFSYDLLSWSATGNGLIAEQSPALFGTYLGAPADDLNQKFGTLWYFWSRPGYISPFMGGKVAAKAGKLAAFGSDNGELVLFDDVEGYDRMKQHRNPKGLLWQRDKAHAGKVKAMAFDPANPSVLATAGGDVKLWNTKDQTYATLIARGSEWIVITDDGYFDASKNGGRLISMVQGAQSFGVDQFAIRNNRPDLIMSHLGLGDSDALAHYKLQHERRVRKAGLTEEALAFDLKVPEAILEPGELKDGRQALKLSCKDQEKELKASTIFVNDVPVVANKPLSGKSIDWTDSITLSSGRNKIELSCTNVAGAESFRALREVNEPAAGKPDLYFLGFGVSKYAEKKLNLQYAAKDATDLGKVFGRMKGAFGGVKVKTFLDKQVTSQAIASAKAFFASAKEDDIAVLFIAGHGVHGEGGDATYYYLTHETKLADLAGSAAPFEAIEDLLAGIAPRKKLFLMDTCESGELDPADAGGAVVAAADSRKVKSRAVRGIRVKAASEVKAALRPYLLSRDRFIFNDLARRTGAIVFSSSRGGEYSYESAEVKNGLFTRALISALTSGAADADKDGQVTTDELRAYVSDEVPRLTKGLQHPTVDRDNLTARFGFPVVSPR